MSMVSWYRYDVRALVLTAVLLGALAANAAADARLNAENYPGTFEQLGPSMASRPTGDFVVAWCDQRSAEPIAYLQSYSSTATPQGANVPVDPYPLYMWGNWWVSAPEVATNSSGLIAVVAPTQNPAMNRHVALWLFDSSARLLRGPIQVSDAFSGGGGDYEPFDASVAMNDAGQICVAWQEDINNDLYVRLFDAAGDPTSGVISLTSDLPRDSLWVNYPVSICMNSAGRAIVSAPGAIDGVQSALAWLIDFGSTDYQRLIVDQKTTYAPDSLYEVNGCAIALQDDGSFCATSSRQHLLIIGQDSYQVLFRQNMARTFDADGTPAGPAIELFSSAVNPQYRLNIYNLARMDNGYLFLGYSYVDFTVYAQRLAADGSRVGETLVLDRGTDSRQASALCAADLGSDRVAFCWQGTGEDDRGNILVGTYNATTAQMITAPQRVHDDLGSNQTNTSLTEGVFGSVLAVWLDDRTSVRQSVWARWLTSAGVPLGEPFQISQQTGYWIRDVKVAGNGTGAAVIVWTAWKNDGYVPEKIYCQRLSAPNFMPEGSNFIVSDPAHNSSDFDADVALAPDNSFVIAYRGTTVDSWSARPYNVYVRRYSAIGTLIGGTIQVNTEAPEEVGDEFSQEMSPSLVMRANGAFGVVWSESLTSVPVPGIAPALQLLTADAVPIGGNMRVTTYPYASTNRPYAAVNADNQYAIGFTGRSGSAGGVNMNGPWVQVFDSNGVALSNYIKMNIGEQDAAPSPAVMATGPDGNFMVAYQVPKVGNVQWEFDDWDIWACRFTPAGQILGTRRMINSDFTEEAQLNPCVLMTGGSALIAWEDERDHHGNSDIYASLIPWSDITAPYGDVNQSGSADVADLTYLIDWLFRGGQPPVDSSAGDVNGDGGVNIADVTALVQYLF